MTIATALPGIIPGRPTGSQQRFATTTVTRCIAPLSGDDANAGTRSAPWKTWRRYLDYIGPAFIDNGALHTILYLEDAPAVDPILPPNVGSTGNLVVQADPSAVVTLFSSSFTATQPAVPATNAPYETSDGALDWSPFVQKRIFDERTFSYSWIFADVGGGSARVSIPTVDFSPGDTYQIQSMPTIGAICLDGTQVVAGGSITFRDLIFSSGTIVSQYGIITSAGTSAISFDRCHLGGQSGPAMQGTYTATSCLVVDPQWNAALPVLDHVGILGGGGGAGVFGGSYVIATQCISYQESWNVSAGFLFADDFGVFSSAGDGVNIDAGGDAEFSGILYGTGNGGYGGLIRRGSNSITWQGAAPTIVGGAGEALVGGAPVLWATAPLDTFGAVISQSV